MLSTSCSRRVAVTRDEDRDGPLVRALVAEGLTPVACPVLVEAPAADRDALQRAADGLDAMDWLIASSARAVTRFAACRRVAWPRHLRTAAVGPATAAALREQGVTDTIVAADGDGADALWATLADAASWDGCRVMVLSTPGGRTVITDHLRSRGADVIVVEAYRMLPRPPGAIAADWTAASADAAVVASPRVAETLVAAIGASALAECRVVAIGFTTAEALGRLGVPHEVAERATFAAVAKLLAAHHTSRPPA